MDTNTETNVGGNTVPPPSISSGTSSESSTPRERVSVRDTIRQSFDQHRERDDRTDREVTEEKKRPAVGESEVDEELETSASDDRSKDSDAERSASGSTEEEVDDATEEKEIAAPKAWSKEAKEHWDALPERARAEIAKREADMEKGVKAIKDQLGQFKEIDDILAPYDQTIQQFGKTRPQAIKQLWSWFEALANNPDEAFPALINSYKMDPRRIVEKYWPGALQRYAQMEQYIKSLPQNQQPAQQQQQAQDGQQQQQPIIHPQVAQYIQQLEQKLTGLEQAVGQRFTAQDQYYEQQNAARTSEYLDQWAKDKPYFERVRMMMGHLLTPDQTSGQAAVPLKEGKVDLDTAYERAIWMDPTIRAELQEAERQKRIAAAKAKKEAAEKAAQAEADRARRASGSLTSSAPGAEVGRKQIPAKGMSVRDSLKQAISDLSGR